MIVGSLFRRRIVGPRQKAAGLRSKIVGTNLYILMRTKTQLSLAGTSTEETLNRAEHIRSIYTSNKETSPEKSGKNINFSSSDIFPKFFSLSLYAIKRDITSHTNSFYMRQFLKLYSFHSFNIYSNPNSQKMLKIRLLKSLCNTSSIFNYSCARETKLYCFKTVYNINKTIFFRESELLKCAMIKMAKLKLKIGVQTHTQ